MTAARLCSHCDSAPAAYRIHDGLCRACRSYLRAYDRLPSREVLIDRERRRDALRLARAAIGMR